MLKVFILIRHISVMQLEMLEGETKSQQVQGRAGTS